MTAALLALLCAITWPLAVWFILAMCAAAAAADDKIAELERPVERP